ncbi:MAG TPA: hypothetical protein VK988_01465 [Acidimicrobiales bacterium]|nr:hypothetical protein [Acidimicrobiales bacterium]
MWEVGPRPNAPGRPAAYSSKPALALGLANPGPANPEIKPGVNGTQTQVMEPDTPHEPTARPDAGVAPHLNQRPAPAETALAARPAAGSEADPGMDTELSRRLALIESALETLSSRVEGLAQAKTALASLVDQVAGTRSQLVSIATQLAAQQLSQSSLERHVADLGKVLGKLGIEVDDRLTVVEMVLDDLGASGHQDGAEKLSTTG